VIACDRALPQMKPSARRIFVRYESEELEPLHRLSMGKTPQVLQ
jgi:hypothetical protein